MRALHLAAAVVIAMTGAAFANDDDLPPLGEKNPEELTINYFKERAINGKSDFIACMHGYFATKVGMHETAAPIFDACVRDGFTSAMTMRAQMYDNGQAGPEDPAAAARLDLMAAEADDPVGAYNYGLDLMRGRGVAQDNAKGREWVDRAAAKGLEAAQTLQAANNNLDVATPDADNWKYERIF